MDTVTYDEAKETYTVSIPDFPKTEVTRNELWDLDHTLAYYILPRLIAFRSNVVGYPADMDPEQYARDLDMMIAAFTLIVHDTWEDENVTYTIETGLALFAKHFRSLWW